MTETLTTAQKTADLFSFDEFIRYWAKDRPDRLAMEGDDFALTYGELEEMTARIVGGLMAMGLKKGDRIAWFGKNSATYFTLFFAAARAGIVMAPIGWRLAEPEAAWIIGNSDAKVLFLGDGFEACRETLGKDVAHCMTAAEARNWIQGLARGDFASVGPDDAVLQLYTSGTTGNPKGAVLSNRNLFRAAQGEHRQPAAVHQLVR